MKILTTRGFLKPCSVRPLYCWAWWHTPLIPVPRRKRQTDFWVRGQPGLQCEFQDNQGSKTQSQKINKQTNKQTKITKIKQKTKNKTCEGSFKKSGSSSCSSVSMLASLPPPVTSLSLSLVPGSVFLFLSNHRTATALMCLDRGNTATSDWF